MEDIVTLKRKRTNLQLRIKEWVDKGKNAKELVVEYHQILNQLKELGVKVENRADYLQLEYWDDFTPEPKTEKKSTPITPSPIIQKEPPVSSKHSYTLCLAWVEQSNETPIQVQKVKDYFEELCLKSMGTDTRKVDDSKTEYVLKYEFEGSDESFRMLKICTQFVLDTFAQSDFDRFNIAVYGKKKNY